MRVLISLVLVSTLMACRSTRPIQSVIAKRDTVNVVVIAPVNDSLNLMKATVEQLRANSIDFNTFSAKVNVDYKGSDGKSYDVNANVRMKKDSAIWISVNAILGIEALRALITKDSVKMLDKQNRVFTERSVDYLQEVTSLPLNLKTLQDLLLGNPVFLDSNLISYSRDATTITVLSLGTFFKNLLTIDEEAKTVVRSKLDDVDVNRNRTADLTYNSYENKKGKLFSTSRRISVLEKKKLDIKLDFKQYDFDTEVSFPFTVPKNYQRN